MNRRVLLVDDMPEFVNGIRPVLQDYEVHVARCGSEGLELCERQGPFAVVVTDHDMPGMSGVDLLAVMQRHWPDTTRIMLTGRPDLDLAVHALHRGAVFRFLAKPVEPAHLSAAVLAGIERFRTVEQERLLTEQLQFSRESLLSLTETLERRLADQLGRMRALQRFSAGLNEARTLRNIAALTAETASRVLGGRAVQVALDHPQHEAEVLARAGGELSLRTHSEAIRTKDRELGFIQTDLFHESRQPLSETDLHVLASLAASAAVAARNQINRSARKDAHYATVYALARLAENRDDETGRHLVRVSEYCRLIAEGLRDDGHFASVLTDAFIENIVVSAPLHDIGKVGIPDSILYKPGKLSEEEWVVMRKHPTIGAETLRHILESSGDQDFLRTGHEIALSHHERWDGSGYPRSLQGDEIPLSARIMALADCYDALTTTRPYKRAWSHKEAMAYVDEQRDRHFDGRIVEAFARRAERADSIRERLTDEVESDDVSSLGVA